MVIGRATIQVVLHLKSFVQSVLTFMRLYVLKLVQLKGVESDIFFSLYVGIRHIGCLRVSEIPTHLLFLIHHVSAFNMLISLSVLSFISLYFLHHDYNLMPNKKYTFRLQGGKKVTFSLFSSPLHLLFSFRSSLIRVFYHEV